MDEFLPLEAAEVHLLQPLHRHELRFREEDLRRLGSALQRGHIDDFRGKSARRSFAALSAESGMSRWP